MVSNGSEPYYKVIITNHIIEVYEMERQPINPQTLDPVDDFLNHIKDTRLLSSNLSLQDEAKKDYKDRYWDDRISKIDRKEERRRQTLRDARNRCRRLALANFNEESLFITLTYAYHQTDIKTSDEQFKEFIKRCYKAYGKFDYIAVREWQKNGRIHYHIICNMNLSWKDDYELMQLEQKFGLSNASEASEVLETHKRKTKHHWGFGWVDIQRLNKTKEGKNVDNVGAYITKYMTKDVSASQLQKKKTYLSSQGLVKPQEYTGTIHNKDINRLIKMIKQKKEAFTNNYNSEYSGKIIYKEYNLKRI